VSSKIVPVYKHACDNISKNNIGKQSYTHDRFEKPHWQVKQIQNIINMTMDYKLPRDCDSSVDLKHCGNAIMFSTTVIDPFNTFVHAFEERHNPLISDQQSSTPEEAISLVKVEVGAFIFPR
jgi:hypothetical protein